MVKFFLELFLITVRIKYYNVLMKGLVLYGQKDEIMMIAENNNGYVT